jgi:hypothetical protein
MRTYRDLLGKRVSDCKGTFLNNDKVYIFERINEIAYPGPHKATNSNVFVILCRAVSITLGNTVT